MNLYYYFVLKRYKQVILYFVYRYIVALMCEYDVINLLQIATHTLKCIGPIAPKVWVAISTNFYVVYLKLKVRRTASFCILHMCLLVLFDFFLYVLCCYRRETSLKSRVFVPPILKIGKKIELWCGHVYACDIQIFKCICVQKFCCLCISCLHILLFVFTHFYSMAKVREN
jgi:hypothetical protein